jgi:hypothetical protein
MVFTPVLMPLHKPRRCGGSNKLRGQCDKAQENGSNLGYKD